MSNAGQAALGVVGGIVGFVVGGPVGAAYGLQLGLAVGSIVSPTQLPGTFGPRLNDNRTTTAQLGDPIVEIWGIDVVPGTVIWLGDVMEQSNTEEVGGKGGPEGENTTYMYRQSIAVGLCRGPTAGLRRVWENGKLVYDTRAPLPDESADDYAARIEAATAYALTFSLYLGNEVQLPDPTLELKEGVGNVPAYRGLMYIVFPNRQLRDDQALRHPTFKFEVLGGAGDVDPVAQGLILMATTVDDTLTPLPDPWALIFVPSLLLDDPTLSLLPDTYAGANVDATDICGKGQEIFAVGKTSESQYFARRSLDAGATWAEEIVLPTLAVEPELPTQLAPRNCDMDTSGRVVVTGTIDPGGDFDIGVKDSAGPWVAAGTLGVESDFRFGVVRYMRTRGYWLCGGYRGIAKSADGGTWTSKFSGVSINPIGFVAGEGRMAAIATTRIYESLDDGETWAEVYEAESPMSCLAFGAGVWVRYVLDQGWSRATSLAGPWSEPTQPVASWQIRDMFYDGSRFVAGGGFGIGTDPFPSSLVAVSGDGLTWGLVSPLDPFVSAVINRVTQAHL